MPDAGVRAVNTSPRYNNGMAAGRRKGNFNPTRKIGAVAGQGGNDYFEQFNAFQDSTIGGEQPGPIQQGWGGFGSISGRDNPNRNSMLATKMNNWLNTFTDPTERAQAMNGIGYFNQGNPYTPEAAKGVNRGYRGYARENQQTGGYSAPGTYLHQSAYQTNPDGTPNMNFGGYIGATTVGDTGAAKYNAFDINRQQGGRQAGALPGQPGGLGGRPQAGGGGGGGNRTMNQLRGQQNGPFMGNNPYKNPQGFPNQTGGGGGNPPRRNQPGRPGPGGGGPGGGGGGGGQGGGGGGGNDLFANFPAPQQAPPDFLPMTPQFEAGRRGLADEYSQMRMDLLNQQAMIQPQYDVQKARMDTDMGFDTDRMKESLAERGVYTPYRGGERYGEGYDPSGAGGGIGQSLYNRDIQIPYGRNYSDLATWAGGQYADIGSQLSGANLAYNQGMAELLLNRAADAAANIPMNVPQYSVGGRVLRGDRYRRPQRPRGRNNGSRK